MKIKLGSVNADLENTNRSAGEALAEVDREINLRMRFYPDWIQSRKLSALDAKDRLERLARAAQIIAASQELDDEKAEEAKAAALAPQERNLAAEFEKSLQGEAKAGIVP